MPHCRSECRPLSPSGGSILEWLAFELGRTMSKRRTAIGGLVMAMLICSGAARAVECASDTVDDTSFTACRVDLHLEHLDLFWRDASGRPNLSTRLQLPKNTLHAWIWRGWVHVARQLPGRLGRKICWADADEIDRLTRLRDTPRGWWNQPLPPELTTPKVPPRH